MRKNRWLALLLVFALVISLCPAALAAEPVRHLKNTDALSSRMDGLFHPGDQVRVIVLTQSQPTLENKTLVQRFVNTDSRLMREHSAVRQTMAREKIDYTVNFEYTALLNGMSLTVDYADLDDLAAIPGVAKVILARTYRLPKTQPSSVAASEMINAAFLSSEISADGSGKIIAVLDTGITPDHEAFGIYDGMLETPAYEKAQMLKAIADLGHGMYYSQKIPFQYDYADNENDAADDHSGHGSHVAGIAAGYAATEEGEITFRGSAPDAQILAMKVFPSDAEETSTDIYLAALEDAYKLGADVINMSLGSPNGFVEDDESVLNERIYERLENAGILCCISAGNESSLAENAQNWAGPGYLTAGYTDYGTLGSPASYNGNIAVAAVENLEYPAHLLVVGEESFPYLDSDGTAFLDEFAGQDPAYVMVPNLGEAEDYDGLDVNGKIAVISRGEITFEEKIAYAAAAGAVAAVVYDNQEGDLVSMVIENHLIPSVFVSHEAGAALASQEEKTFHVDETPTVIDNSNAWSMASFSSWGPTNDLQIKPTITGVGGNVNSVMAGTRDKYEVMSGTSMSAPNVSGGYAALLEAICADNPALSKAEAAAIARNRTLSSAYPLIAYNDELEDGSYYAVPYSPRQQGAGCMDLLAAYDTKLTIGDPLAELGDDPEKNGVYTIHAELENTADEERSYAVYVDVLTDMITGADFGTEEEPDFHLYNCLMPLALSEGEDFTLDVPERVTLTPGEKKTVTVTVQLTDETKEYLDDCFENGAFVDGYVYFDSLDDEEAWPHEVQHVSFLAFYGDWAAGQILETHDWRDIMDLSPEEQEEFADYVDWEIDTVPTEAYLVDEEYSPLVYAGDSPLGFPETGMYSDDRIAVSYNYDTAYATTLLVVPTIVRNARHIVMIARNVDTGEIYAVDDTPYCQKTYYDSEDGWSTYAWFLFDGTDIYSGEEPVPVPDDTRVILEFYANFPYGEDALGAMTPEQIVADGAQYLVYTVPCVVDSTAPVIESCEYDPETGDVTVIVAENQYLSGIYATDKNGNDLADPVLFADEAPGESHTVTLNVGEQISFYVGAMDYATNQVSQFVAIEHDHDWSEWETTAEPTCEEDGGRTRICSICELEETEIIEKLGHDWDEGTVTKEPTLISEGEMLFTCRNDPSHTKTEAIEKLRECDGEHCPSKAFTDVDRRENSWSHVPIDWAVLKGVTNGTSKTTFSPNKACTRAEAVTFLWRASGSPEPKEADCPFTDVKLDSWYGKAVLWAVAQGITKGTSETAFSPSATCTRGQIVTFLWRMEGEPASETTGSFADVPAGAYYAAAVEWAVDTGVTNGVSPTRFAPGSVCTRAHIVTFLWRDLEK